jgi:hypothetical protein
MTQNDTIEADETEEIELRHVTTTPIRREKTQALIAVTKAVAVAGPTGSYTWAPHLVDELGVLPAKGSEKRRGGRGSKYARKIQRRGTKTSPSFLISLPDSVLDKLGLTLEEIGEADDADTPYMIDVYASPSGYLAVRPQHTMRVRVAESDFDPEAKPDDRERDDHGRFE